MQLPSRDEINVYDDDLDGRVACDHFFGKTLEQAEGMFHENSLCYQEDLMWMGPAAFCFYLPAFLNYLRSDSADDADLSCLAMILEYRLENDASALIPIAPQVVSICRHILDHFGRYAVDTQLYGDLQSRLESLDLEFRKLIRV
jgi:hypothetical protein